MGLWIDRLDMRRFESDTDDERPGLQCRQRPVKIAAAIAEPVAFRRPADERGERDLGRDLGRVARRDEDVPVAAHHLRIRRPAAEGEGGGPGFDDRQGDDYARGMQLGDQRAQIRLALDRPTGREDAALRTAELLMQEVAKMDNQPGTDRLPFIRQAARLERKGVAAIRDLLRSFQRRNGLHPGAFDRHVERACDAFREGDDMGGPFGGAGLVRGLAEKCQPSLEMRPVDG